MAKKGYFKKEKKKKSKSQKAKMYQVPRKGGNGLPIIRNEGGLSGF